MTPLTRQEMLRQIKFHEGRRLFPYRDTLGFWTIGYGHNMDADELLQKDGARRARLHSRGCTEAEAHAWLQDDIEQAIRDLIAHLPWVNTFGEVRQAVMVELCFNMGIGVPPGVDPKRPKGAGLRSFLNTLALLRRGDFKAAAENLKRSKWYRQVKSGRGDRLALELETNAWPRPVTPPRNL